MRRLLVCRVDPRFVVAHFAESRELVRSSGTGTKKLRNGEWGRQSPLKKILRSRPRTFALKPVGKKIPGGLGLKPITVEQNSHFCPKNIVWGGGTNGFFRKLSPETTNKTLGKIYLFRKRKIHFSSKTLQILTTKSLEILDDSLKCFLKFLIFIVWKESSRI